MTIIYPFSGEESEPKILVDAEDFHGFPSSFGGLEVKTNDVPGSTFQWYHNGNLIGRDYKLKYFDYSTKKFYVDSSSSNKQEYAGTYQFFMNTPVGTIAGRKVKVAFTCKYCKTVNIIQPDCKNC